MLIKMSNFSKVCFYNIRNI